MIAFPNIDPVILHIYGPIAVRWYGIAYMLGFICSFLIIKKLTKAFLTKKQLDNFFTYSVLGIIVGGRLTYCLIYAWPYFSRFPLEILYLWEGGMSFHGGVIGTIVALYIFCRINNINFWRLSDIAALCAPIGIIFGRIANFINGELYGRITDVPWAMKFPGATGYRHPSQLYEAALEGVLLFFILLTLYQKYSNKRGLVSSIFLIAYAIMRIWVEQFREPDDNIGFIWDKFTMGQILSAIMLVIGSIIFIRLINESKRVKK